jgi:hypothetical protein
VRRDFATSHHLAVGDAVTMTVAGRRHVERVVGIYNPPVFDPLLGQALIDQTSFDAAFPHPQDLYTVLTVDGRCLVSPPECCPQSCRPAGRPSWTSSTDFTMSSRSV